MRLNVLLQNAHIFFISNRHVQYTQRPYTRDYMWAFNVNERKEDPWDVIKSPIYGLIMVQNIIMKIEMSGLKKVDDARERDKKNFFAFEQFFKFFKKVSTYWN